MKKDRLKITFYYKSDDDLAGLQKTLGNKIVSCKIPKEQKGQFKKAYIFLKKMD